MQTGGAPLPLRQNHPNRPSTGDNTAMPRHQAKRPGRASRHHKIRQTRCFRIVRDKSVRRNYGDTLLNSKVQQRPVPQPLPQNRFARLVDAMNLEHPLCDIPSDRRDLHRRRLLSSCGQTQTTSAHRDAVEWGPSTPSGPGMTGQKAGLSPAMRSSAANR